MKKRKLSRWLRSKISKPQAIFLIVVGLLLGTVFSVGVPYWQKDVQKNEAVHLTATFDSMKIVRGKRRRIKELRVRFTDHATLCIRGECASSYVIEELEEAEHGTPFEMYVHPNSGYILELKTPNGEILSFHRSRDTFTWVRIIFIIMGCFAYLAAAVGTIKLIRREVY